MAIDHQYREYQRLHPLLKVPGTRHWFGHYSMNRNQWREMNQPWQFEHQTVHIDLQLRPIG